MEDEIQNFIDFILDMEFIDYKIDLCFTAVYYYLHHHPNNNSVEIDERFTMKETLQHAIKIYPEITNVTWDEFIGIFHVDEVGVKLTDNVANAELSVNKSMYNAFNNTFLKAFCKWRERNWFGMTNTMIKDANNIINNINNTS